MSESFDWSEAAKEGVVAFKSVQAVAVYRNPEGDLVLRQERGPLDNEDSFVIVPRNYVSALLGAIKECMDDDESGSHKG